jgi:hypothetical protein
MSFRRWYQQTPKNRKTTVLLRAVAIFLLLLYLSLLVGARFA